MGVDFDEGTGDDPSAEDRLGQTIIRVGREAAVLLLIDDGGAGRAPTPPA